MIFSFMTFRWWLNISSLWVFIVLLSITSMFQLWRIGERKAWCHLYQDSERFFATVSQPFSYIYWPELCHVTAPLPGKQEFLRSILMSWLKSEYWKQESCGRRLYYKNITQLIYLFSFIGYLCCFMVTNKTGKSICCSFFFFCRVVYHFLIDLQGFFCVV